MALKSLIDTSRQIRSTGLFDDNFLNVNLQSVAEGQTFLQEDLNVLRTLIKNITGETNWYDAPSVPLADVNVMYEKLLIQPVQVSSVVITDGIGATGVTGIAANQSGSSEGFLYDSSVTKTLTTKAWVILRDSATKDGILDSQERELFGIATFNGIDGGTIDGVTNILSIETYVDVNGTATPAVWSGTVDCIVAQRTKLINVNEDFAMTNAAFGGDMNSAEIGTRDYIDYLNNQSANIFGFIANEDITTTLNKISPKLAFTYNLSDNLSDQTGITSNTYTNSYSSVNYVNNGDTFITAIGTIDAKLKTLSDGLGAVTPDNQVFVVSAGIAEGSPVTLPNTKTYDNTDINSMDVIFNGSVLTSDGQAGTVADYATTSSSTITFHFDLVPTDVLKFVIKKS